MPSKILQSLKYFDFFGVSPVLYFQNGGKAKSLFGSFCSYLMIAYIILSVIYSFSDMVYRNNPKVVTSVVKANPNGIPFTTNGFNIGFSFASPFTGKAVSDPGILSNRVMHYKTLFKEGGGKFLGVKGTQIPHENCTKDHYNQAFTDSGICVPKEQNVTISSINSQLLVYQLLRCKNTTNSTHCKPKEVIDKIYISHIIYLVYPKYLVTPDDYKNPITISRGIQSMSGSIGLSKLLNVELMEYEVHTDSGFIFEDISIEKFIQVEKIWIDTSKNGIEAMTTRIYMLEEKTIIKRSYPKIQEAFAGAVALIRIGFLICGFLIIPSAKVNYFQQIIEKTFKSDFMLTNKDINLLKLTQQPEKMKNSEIELESRQSEQLTYEKLQSSNCSEIALDYSVHSNDFQQSSRNKVLQNAILSNHKKLGLEKNQNFYLEQDHQLDSESNEKRHDFKNQQSHNQSKISEDVVDFEQISIQMREKEGKEGVKVQSETQDQTNSNLEPSKQESKLENFQNHFQFSDNTSNSNQKQKPSLVMWFRSSISCFKNKSSQDFKKKQQIIKQELSMTNLIRKLIEFDRLKEVLLEPDQQKLFNNIELFKKKVSVEHSKLVESKKDKKLEIEDLYQMYNKQNKTNVDKKLLEFYINNK